jgi:uncharacterized protein (TIGR00255 family)
MIKSMTGFASLTRETEQAAVTVTAKSVNHRHLDVQIRVPKILNELEQRLRTLVQGQLSRGRIDLSLSVAQKKAGKVVLEINDSLVAALSEAAEAARQRGVVKEGLTAGELFRFPEVVSVKEEPLDQVDWRELCEDVVELTEDTLVQLDVMRQKEGEFLQRDLEERAKALGVLIDGIVNESDAGEEALRERLVARVAEIEERVEVDPILVAQEVVRWAARSDIHEEVSRLRGHLEHMKELMSEAAACGRKLDFLIQEMNREVNTIGSKAEGGTMSELVVAAKSEIEKLREQVQNAE